MSEPEIFRLPLVALQPSQLYISAAKLASVQAGFDPTRLEPLPVKRLETSQFLTDGHTRALAAHLAGVRELAVYWDQDELDWEAYAICVQWCQAAGIYAVPDLGTHILPHDQYERLWHDRCRVMQAGLVLQRKES